jgi:hypothetical protein
MVSPCPHQSPATWGQASLHFMQPHTLGLLVDTHQEGERRPKYGSVFIYCVLAPSCLFCSSLKRKSLFRVCLFFQRGYTCKLTMPLGHLALCYCLIQTVLFKHHSIQGSQYCFTPPPQQTRERARASDQERERAWAGKMCLNSQNWFKK